VVKALDGYTDTVTLGLGGLSEPATILAHSTGGIAVEVVLVPMVW
jgi:hypothetical protein